MNIGVTILSATLAVTMGCQTQNKTIEESVISPNGTVVISIDCPASDCLKVAGEKCPNGYSIIEKSKENSVQSGIPTTTYHAGVGRGASKVYEVHQGSVKNIIEITCK